MTNYAQHVQTRANLQSEQADSRQVANSAGGFSFEVDDWERAKRFLVLGNEGGSYYASEKKLTAENARAFQSCLRADAARAVQLVCDISESGRAPKNDPAIFALALAASSDAPGARAAAYAALPRVCRIGTHLFSFVEQVQQLRGWGRGLKRAVARWYTEKKGDDLAYQLVKYQQRGGFSHRDVLRLCHAQGAVNSADSITGALFRWVVAGSDGMGERTVKRKARGVDVLYQGITPGSLPRIVEGFERARAKDVTRSEIVRLIGEYGLTHEMVPSEHLGAPEVWGALLAKMPMHAMVRNLGRMSANGLLVPGSDAAREVVRRLKDEAAVKKARLHPLAVLMALKTYQQGRGEKGSLSWVPVAPVCDALDDAFYSAFGSIEPSGKRIMLALDVSGSMDSGSVAGSSLTPREAAACMAMVTARVEPDYDLVGFTAASGGYGGQWGGGSPGLTRVPITAKTSLPAVIEAMRKLPMGGTDCALPMLHALKSKQKVDGFAIYTDSETWAGGVHPHQALKSYRQTMGIPARLVVVGLLSNGFTIADPSDAGMLDVVGFDAAAPAVISDFFSGGERSTP